MRSAADDALLAGFGMGDAEAVTAFVRRHQARAFGLARARTVDVEASSLVVMRMRDGEGRVVYEAPRHEPTPS